MQLIPGAYQVVRHIILHSVYGFVLKWGSTSSPHTYEPCYFKLSRETKNSLKQWEFEIADSRSLADQRANTVFPVKPWTPEKISGMFIVSRPIRCEMKPQKITGKPQNWLITTWHETTSSLLLPRRIFNWLFSNTEFLSPFQLFCHQRIDMNNILQKRLKIDE